VRKAPKDEVRARVDELLSLVQLAPYRDRYPDQLSGGQRQRVALARALAPRPKVLLLDEPFGALDARVRQDLRRWLDDLHRELGVTSLLVTHDQDEALELAHRVVVMHEGGVEQIGTPAEIYDEPASAFVAGFVGSANVLSGDVVDGHVRIGEHLVPGAGHLEEGVPARAFVRPHDVVVSTGERNGRSVIATVERVRTLGRVSRVSLRLPDDQVLMAELPDAELDPLEIGEEVFVDVRSAKAFATPETAGAPSPR
jgi:sulfate transport system ATP-binding protein